MRRRPYTTRGISRVKCAREGCNNRAVHTFNICAIGQGNYVPVCGECDMEINHLVVRFVFGKSRDAELRRYSENKT